MQASSLPQQLAALRKEVFPLQILSRPNQHNFLISEQTILRRRRNTMNSPLNRMPFEIISIIFFYATTFRPSPNHFDSWEVRRSNAKNDPEDVFFSVTLAAVCSLWRDVALSTPRLWTYFEYPECLWKREKDSRYLLPLYLRNSKHLPIHLCLNFLDDASDKSFLWHPSHDRTLISNSIRIRSLSLQNPPLRWISQLKRLPFVVDLSIDWKSSSLYFRDRLPLHKCHALSRFSLHKAGLNAGRIIYQTPATLTILDLSNIPIDICIKVMLRCPNLVEAYIRHQRDEEEFLELAKLKETWFTEPVGFRYLKVLLWDMCMSHEDSNWVDAFFENLSTPILCTLVFMETCDGQMMDFLHGETRFIKQLPKTLRTFEIWEAADLNVESLGSLLNWQSSVEEFTMVNCDVDVLTRVFRTLVPGTSTSTSRDSSSSSSSASPMPRLKTFRISTTRFDEDEFDEWTRLGPVEIDVLVGMLEQRLGKRSGGMGMRVEIEGFGVDWTPRVQMRLRALVRREARLEIVEDSEAVHWLSNVI